MLVMSLCLKRPSSLCGLIRLIYQVKSCDSTLRLYKCSGYAPIDVSKRWKSGQGSVKSVMTVSTAKDLIGQLSKSERRLLLDELQKFQAAAAKGDDPSPPPSFRQLRAVFNHNALPFIGFGFLDNFIMILAGDYIDATIGLTLGISTMAAAALGNTISDIAGIGSAWYVESFATRLGILLPPVLTPAQIDMYRTRWSANLGRAGGITLGCIIGMLPLLFISEKQPLKEDSEETEVSVIP
ncbi:Transmembrane protein 65 [Nymphon striatum]|nr:Transmembrane protein 65 [Nymphon striatum]